MAAFVTQDALVCIPVCLLLHLRGGSLWWIAGCVAPGHRLYMFLAFLLLAKLLSKVVVLVVAQSVSAVAALVLIKAESIKLASQMGVF